MPIPAAVVAGGAAVVSQGINALSQGNMNKKNRAFAREMWEKQNAVNDANWHRDNAYNSPANQRKLYEEGGYNPALMYDSGGFQSSSAPAAPGVNSPMTKAPEFDGAAVMSSYYDAKLRKAQLDNLEGATRNAAASTAADVAQKTAATSATVFDTGQRVRLADTAAEAAVKSNKLLDADISLRTNQGFKSVDERQEIVARIDAIKQQMKHDKDKHPLNMEILKGNAQFQKFKADLQSMGLTESDGVLWRLFGNMFRSQPVTADKPYNW